MKLFTFLLVCTISITACNSKSEDKKSTEDVAIHNDGKSLDLPYKLARIPDWEKGDDNNVPIAMNFLKTYEDKDFVSMRNYLADTVQFIYDNGNFSGTADQMVKFLKNFRDARKTVRIEMNDYESVRSKNRNQEYVSLWYNEHIVDNAGKADSAFVMDDYRIKNGKISMIDTKFRHLRNGN